MSKILNIILCAVMIFALSFLWVYYSLKSAVWAITLAAVLTICSSYVIWRLQNKANESKSAKQQNKKAVANLYDYLQYNADNASVFAELYRYYHYDVEQIDFDNFVATKEDVSTYVCLYFKGNGLTTNDVQQAIVTAKRRKIDKVCVYCAKVDPQIRKTATEHYDVSFVDVSNAYELLNDCDKLPTLPKVKPVKNSFVAKYAFCRQRFWWYFGSCIFMTLVSVVAYFPYYTLGWATVMLALALYSLFNTRYNVKRTGVKLD